MDEGVVDGGAHPGHARCRRLHRHGDRTGIDYRRAPSGWRRARLLQCMPASGQSPASLRSRFCGRSGDPSNACITIGNTISTGRTTVSPTSTPSRRGRPATASARSNAKTGAASCGSPWIPRPSRLREYLQCIPLHLDPYHFERMVQTRDITVEWDCNWKASVDAFNESYHVQGIHPQLLWHLHDLGHPNRLLRDATAATSFPSAPCRRGCASRPPFPIRSRPS